MAAAAAVAVRALVVEDDPDSCDALMFALRAGGFDAECATTVGEALVKLEAGPTPDAVVLDLRLPDASGGLLLRRIRRDRLPVKVALVTGVADPGHHVDLLRYPADRIFRKPVDVPELLRWLKSVT